MTELPEDAVTANEPESPHADVRLPVLPSSGKVDQLRREFQTADDGERAATAPPSPGAEVPVAPSGEAPAVGSPDFIQRKLLEGKVIAALRAIYDPEIPVNIYDLGLIYDIDVKDDRSVRVRMTLTAPACPVAGTLPGEVEQRIENIPEVKSADVELVWEPPWDRSRMSEAAQLELGFF